MLATGQWLACISLCARCHPISKTHCGLADEILIENPYAKPLYTAESRDMMSPFPSNLPAAAPVATHVYTHDPITNRPGYQTPDRVIDHSEFIRAAVRATEWLRHARLMCRVWLLSHGRRHSIKESPGGLADETLIENPYVKPPYTVESRDLTSPFPRNRCAAAAVATSVCRHNEVTF